MTHPIPSLQRPSTPAELADAIRSAASSNMQVRLTGSNSLPLTQFDPARPLQQISTLRLNKLLEHAVSDMTVIVQAGIILESLQQQLAWHNQWLPIDPPSYQNCSPGQRTLGGLIASNSLGPLRFGSGDWRLLIMGLTWVDATGTLIKGGGRTLKNVAGYSTPRLMIGSCGSLGAIAEITLRTFTRPSDEQSVIFYCDSAQRAEQLLSEILLAPVTPAYLEAIGARTFATNPLQLPAPKSGLALVAGFLDRLQSCTAQIEILRKLPAAQNLESLSQPAAPSGRLRLWLTSEPTLPLPSPPSATARANVLSSPNALALRIHALSSQTCTIIDHLESADSRRRSGDVPSATPEIWAVSEAATGIIRTVLNTPDAPVILQNLMAQFPGITILTTQGSAQSTSTSDPDLTRRLKSQLDPASTFGQSPA